MKVFDRSIFGDAGFVVVVLGLGFLFCFLFVSFVCFVLFLP